MNILKAAKDLKKERNKIDTIDSRIIRLLSNRLKIAKRLGKLKKKKGLRIADKAREKEVIEHAKMAAEHTDIDKRFIESLFKDIIRYTRNKQK